MLGFFFLCLLLLGFPHNLAVEGLGSLRPVLRDDLLNRTSPGVHTFLAFCRPFDDPPLSLFSLLHKEVLPFLEMPRAPSAPLAFFCSLPAFFDICNFRVVRVVGAGAADQDDAAAVDEDAAALAW